MARLSVGDVVDPEDVETARDIFHHDIDYLLAVEEAGSDVATDALLAGGSFDETVRGFATLATARLLTDRKIPRHMEMFVSHEVEEAARRFVGTLGAKHDRR